MKYQFIEEHKHEFPIVGMGGMLVVSESGFYAWRKRPTGRRKQEDAHLLQEIQQIFKMHQSRYGSPRSYRDLHDEGIKCSRKRVARLMQEEELSAKSKRRRVITTKRDETHPVALNILNRDFQAEEPNKKWVTDITYIPTKQGYNFSFSGHPQLTFTEPSGVTQGTPAGLPVSSVASDALQPPLLPASGAVRYDWMLSGE